MAMFQKTIGNGLYDSILGKHNAYDTIWRNNQDKKAQKNTKADGLKLCQSYVQGKRINHKKQKRD